MDMLTLFLCLGVFLLGAISGSVVTLSLIYPVMGRTIGRVVGRIIATVALALSAALLTWPTVALIRGEQLRSINLPLPNASIANPAEAYGWCACLLVLGGISLWFSFLIARKKPEVKAEAGNREASPPV